MKKNNGAIVIEATFLLPLFMAVMLTFVSLARVALIEARMQFAADQTAKEVSNLYYVAYKFGLNPSGPQSNSNIDKALGQMNKLKNTAQEELKNVGDSTKGTIQSVKSLASSFSSVQNGITAVTEGDIQGGLSSIMTTIEDIDFSNPMETIKVLSTAYSNVSTEAQSAFSAIKNVNKDDLKSVGANLLVTGVNRFLSVKLSKALFPKYINENERLCDSQLRNWLVEDGFDGVNFGGSSFLGDGQSIKVVVDYKIQLFTLGFWEYEITSRNVGVTRAWIGNGKNPNTNATNRDAPSITEYKKTSS